MNNKKKYEFGSIQIIPAPAPIEDVYALKDEEPVNAPQFYPINGKPDFSDPEKFNRIAMAGPFTSP